MENQIEIKNYRGNGFQSLVSFETWRVAVLRYLDDVDPAKIGAVERHTQTDEVFILLEGRGLLFTAGKDAIPGRLDSYPMKFGEIVNIKKSTWHTLALSTDAHLVIIENDNTSENNTEYAEIQENDLADARSLAVATILTHPAY